MGISVSHCKDEDTETLTDKQTEEGTKVGEDFPFSSYESPKLPT